MPSPNTPSKKLAVRYGMPSAFLGIITLNIVVLSVPATMVVITITNAIIVALTELRLKFWIVAASGANGLLMLTHP